jgi:hypothetical protein
MCIPVIAGTSPTDLTLLKQSGRMTLVDSPLLTDAGYEIPEDIAVALLGCPNNSPPFCR